MQPGGFVAAAHVHPHQSGAASRSSRASSSAARPGKRRSSRSRPASEVVVEPGHAAQVLERRRRARPLPAARSARRSQFESLIETMFALAARRQDQQEGPAQPGSAWRASPARTARSSASPASRSSCRTWARSWPLRWRASPATARRTRPQGVRARGDDRAGRRLSASAATPADHGAAGGCGRPVLGPPAAAATTRFFADQITVRHEGDGARRSGRRRCGRGASGPRTPTASTRSGCRCWRGSARAWVGSRRPPPATGRRP